MLGGRYTNARALTALLLIAVAQGAAAVPVEWVFKNVSFIGGNGAVIGGFTYDAESNTLSNISVTTTPGLYFLCSGGVCDTDSVFSPGPAPSTTYEAGTSDPTGFLRFDGPALDSVIAFALNAPLTNAGGTVAIRLARQWVCPSAPATCANDTQSTPFRSSIEGYVTTSVPAPGTFLLTLLALFAVYRKNGA